MYILHHPIRGSVNDQVRPTIAAESGATAQKLASVASIDDDEKQLEGLPIEELEAKMTSVQEALERFDAVKVGAIDPLENLDCCNNVGYLTIDTRSPLQIHFLQASSHYRHRACFVHFRTCYTYRGVASYTGYDKGVSFVIL